MDIFPFEDPIVVKRLKGSEIWNALENGISLIPAMEGRFPQISGIRFIYNPNLPPMKRIISCQVQKNQSALFQDIDLNEMYTVATREYMARGKDGYTSLLTGEFIVDNENGLIISTLLRRFFRGLGVINMLKQPQKQREQGDSNLNHENSQQQKLHLNESPLSPSPFVQQTVQFAVNKFKHNNSNGGMNIKECLTHLKGKYTESIKHEIGWCIGGEDSIIRSNGKSLADMAVIAPVADGRIKLIEE